MPFVELERLSELYKEIEEERKSRTFFQDSYLKNKKRLKRKSNIFAALLAASFVFLVITTFLVVKYTNQNKVLERHYLQEQSFTTATSEALSQKKSLLDEIKKLQLENSILGGNARDIQNILEEYTVHTVQIAAMKKADISLISPGFINFRQHPFQTHNLYSLGNFESKEEAKILLDFLKRMGFEDAFVTSFKAHRRILVNE